MRYDNLNTVVEGDLGDISFPLATANFTFASEVNRARPSVVSSYANCHNLPQCLQHIYTMLLKIGARFKIFTNTAEIYLTLVVNIVHIPNIARKKKENGDAVSVD
jgi:hypothetical protein